MVFVDLWEDLKVKWETEQWKRGLRLQMALENIQKCGGAQEIMARRNAGACLSQNLNRQQACHVWFRHMRSVSAHADTFLEGLSDNSKWYSPWMCE
jgi:hypothetical protein